jgi:hypothetical protein
VGEFCSIDSERQEAGERRFAEAVMKKGPEAEIEFGKWEFYSVRNDRGLYELHPKPMSIEQLIAAAANTFKRDLPRSSVDNSRLEQRRMTARVLFNLATSKLWMSVTAASISWNKDLALDLIARANDGDREAQKVLRDAALVFINRSLPLPPELGDYVVDPLPPVEKKKRGAPPQSKGKNDLRDRMIADMVKQVLLHCVALLPTRNAASEHESACSIVARAFTLASGENISESSINTIWSDSISS